MSETAEELQKLRFGIEHLTRGLTAMNDTLAIIVARLELVERSVSRTEKAIWEGPDGASQSLREGVSFRTRPQC